MNDRRSEFGAGMVAAALAAALLVGSHAAAGHGLPPGPEVRLADPFRFVFENNAAFALARLDDLLNVTDPRHVDDAWLDGMEFGRALMRLDELNDRIARQGAAVFEVRRSTPAAEARAALAAAQADFVRAQRARERACPEPLEWSAPPALTHGELLQQASKLREALARTVLDLRENLFPDHHWIALEAKLDVVEVLLSLAAPWRPNAGACARWCAAQRDDFAAGAARRNGALQPQPADVFGCVVARGGTPYPACHAFVIRDGARLDYDACSLLEGDLELPTRCPAAEPRP